MVESDNKHQKEPFPAELQFAFMRMRPLREETQTEREGAYRPKTDSEVKTSVLFFFLRLAIRTACQSQNGYPSIHVT